MRALVEQLYMAFSRGGSVSTDSRKITPGCIFFGLKGEHVDGSMFGPEAVEAGATLAVVRRGSRAGVDGIVEVEDPLVILQQLAAYHRKQLSIPVIAITGSNGKTTTKELIHRTLSSMYSTRATEGNLNNHIGVPLTLLSVVASDELAVIEMGANHPGEISALCALARPTHGLVTNIGKAHLQGFGDMVGVKRTKSELYTFLARHAGVAFVNADEPYLKELSHVVAERIFYGFGKHSVYSKNRIQFVSTPTPDGHAVDFRDAYHARWTTHSTLFGNFNLANMASAITVALHFNISGDKISHAIASYQPDNNRAQRIRLGSNEIILDAYNANPSSMISAIRSFDAIAHPHKVLILGAMMELGDYTEEEHKNIVRYVSGLTGSRVMYVGEYFRRPAGHEKADWFTTAEELARSLKAMSLRNALILVKGSRAMQLERVLAAFQ